MVDAKKSPFDDEPIVFELEQAFSSGDLVRTNEIVDDVISASELVSTESSEKPEELSPVMKELASVELPKLEKENRARLQMQSPTKLFFYWSTKGNPFQMLNRSFGGNTGSSKANSPESMPRSSPRRFPEACSQISRHN